MFANRIALIGGAFGLLASLNSFLIAYDEGKRRRSSGLDLWLKPVYKAAVECLGVTLAELFITLQNLQMRHELGEVFALQGALRDRVPNRLCLF